MKVKLLENLRYFEQDDTDFIIDAGQVKELPEKYLRSYSIKTFLFTGRLRLVEGSVLYHMKSALIYIDSENFYVKEFGRFFTKDLEFDAITWLAEDKIPKNILYKLNNNTTAEPISKEDTKEDTKEECSTDVMETEVEEELDKVDFSKMTLEEIKAYNKAKAGD